MFLESIFMTILGLIAMCWKPIVLLLIPMITAIKICDFIEKRRNNNEDDSDES